jgi:nicotinamide mononucleotide (NMN) deamidase PncC
MWLLAVGMAVGGAGSVWSADASVLTRAQWLRKIGESVKQEQVLRETLAQVAVEERVEFTQRLLKAVTRMPVGPDEKAAAFVRAAVACIAGPNGETKNKVIAEVFACVPVEYLPVVTEELAKRFDQEYNKLSDEQYAAIAVEAVKVAVARNAQTDEPSVRNTFVILAFLRNAKNPAELQKKLLELLPDERMRSLVSTWLAAALKDRNYEGLLAAADVEALVLSTENMLRFVGHTQLDRLLSQLSGVESLATVIGTNLNTAPTSGLDTPSDFGINRRPIGYQDQGSDIKKPDTNPNNPCECDGVSWIHVIVK